jgi:hypothetical protein
MGPLQLLSRKPRSAVYEMDPQGSMNTLLKVPRRMDESSKRYEFPPAYSEVESYIKRSNAMITALTDKPTKPMRIEV